MDEETLQWFIDQYDCVCDTSLSRVNEIEATRSYVSPIQEYAPFSSFQQWPDSSHPNTYGYGIEGKFHPFAQIYTGVHYAYSCCLAGARSIFDTTSYLYYDYNIYGEDKGTTGSHEGVDLQHTAGNKDREVKSVTIGTYSGIDEQWGAVCVYDANLLTTVVYEHLDTTGYTLNLNQSINVGTVLGKEGNTGLDEDAGRHLHFEVHPNENYSDDFADSSMTYVAVNGNLTLVSGMPYTFLIFYT